MKKLHSKRVEWFFNYLYLRNLRIYLSKYQLLQTINSQYSVHNIFGITFLNWIMIRFVLFSDFFVPCIGFRISKEIRSEAKNCFTLVNEDLGEFLGYANNDNRILLFQLNRMIKLIIFLRFLQFQHPNCYQNFNRISITIR